jgi:hypothetical protein
VEYSEPETVAFNNWSNLQIGNAIRHYPKNRNFQLRSREGGHRE